MHITKVDRNDLQEILDLQYLAYQSEALLLNDFAIPPLKQTLKEVEQEFENGMFLKAIDDNDIIIGSVRAYTKNDTLYIGKLIVHPNFQGQGIGSKLLIEIEKAYPQERYELFTSDRSVKNIRLYERLGYVKYKEHEEVPGLKFIYLQK